MEDNVNNIIFSFGLFIAICAATSVPKEIAVELMFELLDNPIKYGDREVLRTILNERLNIDAYIELMSMFKI